MRAHAIYLRIGKRDDDNHSPCVVRLTGLDDPVNDYNFKLDIPPTSSLSPSIPQPVLDSLARHVTNYLEFARARRADSPSFSPSQILLDVEPDDLVPLDWENLLQADVSASAPVTRFVDESDIRVA